MAEMRVSLQTGDGVIGTIGTNGFPAAVPVASGQVTAFTTLSAVTGNATGATLDCGMGRQIVRIVCVGTSTLAGTLTIEGSVDGTNFISTGTTVALTAAATVTVAMSNGAFRYYRTSLSGASGAGTATCLMMAGG